eukprot:COSAG02_NODE_4474_length_5324_cov_19.463028_5_plen_47_part_00
MEYAKSVKGDDYYNLDGTALSYLVQTMEKRWRWRSPCSTVSPGREA